MHFIVFWKEWNATIPSSWLFMKSKTFKWPPKSINPAFASKKEILPQENWHIINYSRLIGPFATFEESRQFEIQAVNDSSNDKSAVQEITNKVTNKSLPLKREINKSRRFCSSSDEEHEKLYVKNKKLSKSKITDSVPRNKNEDEESNENSEKKLNSHNIQENFQKPPTHYIPNNGNKEITSKVAAGDNKNRDVSNSNNKDNNLDTVSENPPLDYRDMFSQESFVVMKKSKPINNIVEFDFNETQDMFEAKDDVNNMNQISSRQNKLDIRFDKNSAHLQSNIEQQNKRRTHEHHDLCCAPCRTDIQAIKKAINSIYFLVLDMSEGPHNDSNNLTLNLPITTEKELNDIEILLKEDAAARLQYKKIIKNIGGKTFEKHVRNALTATLIDQMAYKMSWTGHKNTISVKKMKFIDLIIETIINSRTDSTIDKVQTVIKTWLQHAGDRLPKEGTNKKIKII